MSIGAEHVSSPATAGIESQESRQSQPYTVPRKPVAEVHVSQEISSPRLPSGATSTPARSTNSRSHQLLLPWTLAAITATVYAITVSYALGTTRLRYISLTNISPSRSLALLRTLSEITSLCLFFLIGVCTERLMWIYVSRKDGTSLATFLALHYGSGALSWLQLIVRNAKGGRLLAILGVACTAAIRAMGIVLLSAVEIQLSFDSQTTFPVAAGVGNFNPAYATEYTTVAATYMTSELSSLLQSHEVAWPTFIVESESINCTQVGNSLSNDCGRGYFLHGGYKLVTPCPTENTSMPSSPIYTIHSVRGVQLDFTNLKPSSRFQGQKDCAMFGGSVDALQLCISQYSTNAINAKYVACPSLLQGSCLNDTSWLASTGWSTTMTAYARHATIHISRTNLSTVSVTDFSSPVKYSLSAVDMFSIFNTTFRATDLSGRTLYPSEQLIRFLNIYLQFASSSSPTTAQASLGLHNLLTMPLYYFQPTYLSPYTKIPYPGSVVPGLPADQGLYTTASFSTFYYGLVVAPWTIYTYAIVMGIIVCLCLVTLTLSSIPNVAKSVPDTTPWPFIDVAAECRLVDNLQRDASVEVPTSPGVAGRDSTYHCARRIKATKGFWAKADTMAGVRVKLINHGL